jgi:hypothetical protein
LSCKEKGELLVARGITMIYELIFRLILRSKDGDYVFQAQMLAAMKPNGW